MLGRFVLFFTSFLPTLFPIGEKAQEKWAKDVVSLSGVPDNSSTRFALAVMILHRPPYECRKPKRYFANMLYKAAANEVAHAVAEKLKKAQKDAAEKVA